MLGSSAGNAKLGGEGSESEELEEDELELELSDAFDATVLAGLALCLASMSATSCTKEARQCAKLFGAILTMTYLSLSSLSSWLSCWSWKFEAISAMAARIVPALVRAAALDTDASLI